MPQPNVKTLFTADTSGIRKGANEAKQALKDYENNTKQILGNVSKSFGASEKSISSLTNIIKGGILNIGEAAGMTEKQTVSTLRNIAELGGVAGMAIIGISKAWDEVKQRANYYWESMEGSIQKSGLDAYKQTLKNVVTEHYNLKRAADSVSNVGKFWTNLRQGIRSVWIELKEGAEYARALEYGYNPAEMKKAKSSLSSSATETKKAYQELIAKSEEARNAYSEAVFKARAAEVVQQRITALQIQELQQSSEIYKMDSKIADLELKTKDTELSAAERQAAMNELQKLFIERKKRQLDISNELKELQEVLNSLTLTGVSGEKTYQDIVIKIAQLEKQHSDAQKSQLKTQKQITKAVQEEAEARAKAAEMEKSKRENAEWLAQAKNVNFDIGKTTVIQPKEPITIPVKAEVEIDTNDISNQLESVMSSVAKNLGETIGEIIAGEEDFTDGLLSMVADLAVQVGEIAIGLGTSLLAIKAALMSFNPYVAIAAGAALVALGTWAKSSLASTAEGVAKGANASFTAASSSEKMGNYDRGYNVEVTGKLVGEGSQLVAVINNTNKEKNYIG